MAARSEEMLVRVTPELRAEIERAAEEERRSLASVIRHALLAREVAKLGEIVVPDRSISRGQDREGPMPLRGALASPTL